MQAILCLADYSPHSAQTFGFARQLAQQLNGDLLLAYVAESGPDEIQEEEWEPVPAAKRESDDPESEELQRLRKFAGELVGDENESDFSLRLLVVGGNPRDRILEIADQYEVDVIVMGMRNRGGLAGRIFGSLAQKLINKSPCPVLLIPPNATITPVTEIVYATNFSYGDLTALDTLLLWSEGFAAKLKLLHISEDPDDLEWAESQMEKILHTFEEEDEDRRMSFEIQEGDVLEGIESYLQKSPVNLLALTTRTRSFWEHWLEPDLVRELTAEVSIPVLVFKN